MSSTQYELIANSLDRLITVEVRPKGYMDRIYTAARGKFGKPLILLAAQGIINHVKPGSNVILTTGAHHPLWMQKGETDGPPGTASITRAIEYGLEAKPIILCEAALTEMMSATFVAAGLSVHPYEEFLKVPHSVCVKDFTTDVNKAKAAAKELLDQTRPSAVICVEKAGPNAKGVLHSMKGSDVGAGRSKVSYLVDEARARGIWTMGIGDGGNEIGFGALYDEVRDIFPTGRKCICPCGDGVVTVTKTDSLVVASVSNHGAYAVTACLAVLLNRRDLLQSAAIERRMVEACVMKGAVDGILVSQTPTADGVNEEGNVALLEVMRSIVDCGLEVLRGPSVRDKAKLT